jgi:filamentous hemagglutinin
VLRFSLTPAVADDVIKVNGETWAVEAKFVGNWTKSIANPQSVVGKLGFSAPVRQKIVDQAIKYSNHFDRVKYHKNSVEFARYYNNLFQKSGLKNVEFIITPIKN